MRFIVKSFLVLIISLMSLTCNAQKNTGDKLFSMGQEKQQIMTEKSQKEAIAYYTKAIKAYDSAAMKTKCRKQIKICQNTIKAAPWKKKVIVKHTDGESNHFSEKTENEGRSSDVLEYDTTRLSLSESSLEFNSKTHTETIRVNCNRTDWKFDNLVSWISITQNGEELTLSIEKNKEKEDRETVLRVTCGKKVAELKIVQHQWTNIFKKTKEKIVGK